MDNSIRSDGLPVTISAQWPRPSVCLVRVAGELDIATASPLVGFLRDNTVRNPAHLVLDLSGIRFLASSGVGAILSAMHNADGIRGQLHLIGVTDNPAVARVLDLAGVRPLLDIHDNLGHLLAHINRD
jgi:anti-anti-sigma factor